MGIFKSVLADSASLFGAWKGSRWSHIGRFPKGVRGRLAVGISGNLRQRGGLRAFFGEKLEGRAATSSTSKIFVMDFGF
jgi:hypothetical protein